MIINNNTHPTCRPDWMLGSPLNRSLSGQGKKEFKIHIIRTSQTLFTHSQFEDLRARKAIIAAENWSLDIRTRKYNNATLQQRQTITRETKKRFKECLWLKKN